VGETIAAPELHWEAQDFERKLAFKGAKYTGTNTFLTFCMGLAASVAFYLALVPFMDTPVGQIFYRRGIVPYPITLLSFWSLAILLVKWRKLCLQRRALEFSIMPDDPSFVLSPLTADEALRRIRQLADNPKHFLLLNRLERCLSNLKNLGRVADVDDTLRSQAENDENYMESTYTLAKGFIWAIPVFGFIGTVMGLSMAIGGFGGVLSQGSELGQLREALRNVTIGLSVAFDTTFIGLVGAVTIQLLLNGLKKKEEEFLDECSDYCHKHIVSKLRLLGPDEHLAAGAQP